MHIIVIVKVLGAFAASLKFTIFILKPWNWNNRGQWNTQALNQKRKENLVAADDGSSAWQNSLQVEW
jgi:hypothetical protein